MKGILCSLLAQQAIDAVSAELGVASVAAHEIYQPAQRIPQV